MPESKSKKCHCGKDCQCCSKNIFPICFLACVMTAVLVTFCCAVALTAQVAYRNKNNLVLQSSGQFLKEANSKYSQTIAKLSAKGLIDFYGSNQTGFIYASAQDCLECQSFVVRLFNAAKELGIISTVYQYTYPTEPTEYDKFAHQMTIANENGPVLIYVRNGKIYDRLDEVNGDLSIKTFLNKYK